MLAMNLLSVSTKISSRTSYNLFPDKLKPNVDKKMKFKDPETGSIVETNDCFWWSLLAGPIYFIYKRVWLHVFLSFATVLAGIAFLGLIGLISSLLGYAYLAEKIVRNNYLKKGWEEVAH